MELFRGTSCDFPVFLLVSLGLFVSCWGCGGVYRWYQGFSEVVGRGLFTLLKRQYRSVVLVKIDMSVVKRVGIVCG